MRLIVSSILFIYSIVLSLELKAQDLTERINTEFGYILKTYSEDFKLKKTSEFVNEELVRFFSFNPSSGFQEGLCFDGVNTFLYDSLCVPTAIHEEVIIDVTEEFQNQFEDLKDRYSYDYDDNLHTEILIRKLNLNNGQYSGTAEIVAYTYKKIDDRHPYYSLPLGQFCLKELQKNAPYLTISHYWELEPISVEVIGTFEIKNNQYNGIAELHLPGFEVSAILINDSPIKFECTYTDVKTGQTEFSSFQCGKETYTYKNELFKSPSIDIENHSFLLLKEKQKNQDLSVEKFSHYPFIQFDFLTGSISMSNYDISIERQGDGIIEPVLELVYYDSTGTYYTATIDGQLHRFYGSDAITKIDPIENLQLPRYYYRISSPDWLHFSNINEHYKLRFDPKKIIESSMDNWTRKYHKMNVYGDPSWNCELINEQKQPISKRDVLLYLNNKSKYLRTSNGVTEIVNIHPGYIIFNFHFSITYNWASLIYSDYHYKTIGIEKKSAIHSNMECYGLESTLFENLADIEQGSIFRNWTEAEYSFSASDWVQSGKPKYITNVEE